MLDWDDLRVFLAVAREGGLMPASRKLAVDQTTVARRLGALEGALGARLIERSSRGARLTPDGQTLLEHVERIEGEVFRARAQLGSAEQHPSGVVRLATPEAFGAWIVSPAMAALKKRHPDLLIELLPLSRSVSLSKRDADIAVTLNRPAQGEVLAQKLVDYQLGLFASKEYLAEHPPVQTIDDLRAHPIVWYIDDLLDIPELRYLEQVAPNLPTAFRSSSIVAQQMAVTHGFGLGLLHLFAAKDDASLVRLLPDEITVNRTYWLAFQPDQGQMPRIRAVIDFLHEIVRGQRSRFAVG